MEKFIFDTTDAGAITITVVALVQLLKWSGINGKIAAPFFVFAASTIGVLLFAWSNYPEINVRQASWPIFVAIITIATSAAGVFGFTRATSELVRGAKKKPPSGEPEETA